MVKVRALGWMPLSFALAFVGCVADTADVETIDPSIDEPVVVLEFEGEVDVEAGTMTIRFAEPLDESATPGLATADLTELTVVNDGVAGSGPADTVELVTTSSGVDVTGSANCGTVAGGHANCFWGLVDLRHFFAGRHVGNAYAQLTAITAGFEAYDDVSNTPLGLDSTRGLWRYGSLEPAGATYSVGTRRWRFRLPTVSNFTFSGRVMATLHAVGGPNAPNFVSVNSLGESVTGDARAGCVSDTGRYTVFSTTRALLPTDTNGRSDIYRADLTTGELVLVSVRTTGALSTTGDATTPCVSANGDVVVYASTATDMTASPDTNGVSDIFARVISTSITTAVSTTTSGTYPVFCAAAASGNGSLRPALSSDGRYVAFDSTCARLCGASSMAGSPATGCEPGRPQVYRKDRVTGVTTGVSLANGSTTLYGGANEPSGPTRDVSLAASISNDGNRVVFESTAGGTGALVSGDGTVRDTYLRVISATTTTRISLNLGGASSSRISGDGTTIAFSSTGAQGLPDANASADIYRFVLAGAPVGGLSTPGTMTLQSVTSGGGQPSGAASGVWLNNDGCRMVIQSLQALATPSTAGLSNVYYRNACASSTTTLSQNADGAGSNGQVPSIAFGGGFALFESAAVNYSLDGAVQFDAGGFDVFTVRLP